VRTEKKLDKMSLKTKKQTKTRELKKELVREKKKKDFDLTEVEFYKRYFIKSEFMKQLKDILQDEEDEGLLVFIKMIFCFEMIEDFCDYGESIIDIDFTDYFKEDKCFFCFINFNLENFLDRMRYFYYSKLEE